MSIAMASVMFCFNNLNKLQALTLQREVQSARYLQQNSTTQSPALFSGQIPLYEGQIDDIISFFIKQQLSVEQCQIVISGQKLQSSDGSTEPAVLPVPNIVNHMLKHIDCTLIIER
ncbi:hypothetical protein [Pseudoalteromonas tunicata]|uniref:hypothetical protein n=1 Tax=Pseudoalteromonas tunicata TaxID=314281 RepID=UPI00273F2304|nr:hypothetical protein [Pseudoalteromonas tunicata]MDP4983811.1 hypothetical protein [Pseudoalteromonas tunicata]MDP5211466.1 hypothetical protein [Pseudoalteromonas tunicata]